MDFAVPVPRATVLQRSNPRQSLPNEFHIHRHKAPIYCVVRVLPGEVGETKKFRFSWIILPSSARSLDEKPKFDGNCKGASQNLAEHPTLSTWTRIGSLAS
ncbi:MAG: hypothetical protein H7833_01295 [Magnetococcus sp. DMHC-1]